MIKQISEKDKELIEQGVVEKRDLRNVGITNEYAVRIIYSHYEDYLKERLTDQPLFIIGAGIKGFSTAQKLMGYKPYNSEKSQEYINTGITRIVTVDPFFDKETLISHVKKEKGDNFERITHEQTDALTFLLNQPDKSGNVLTDSLDQFILPNKDYARRVVEEIFRVIPQGGAYLCNACDVLEEFALKIFKSKKRDFFFIK